MTPPDPIVEPSQVIQSERAAGAVPQLPTEAPVVPGAPTAPVPNIVQPEPAPVLGPEPAPVEPTSTLQESASIPESEDAEPEPDDNGPAPETASDRPDVANEPPLTWQASEYLHHAKSVGWYLALIGVLVILSAVAAWFHQWLAIAVFVAAFAAVMVYGGKAPRTLNYTLDSKGLTIEGKVYPFDQFRSFGVVDEVAWQSIDLEPTKRFMPRLTILAGADNKDQIIARLSAEMPRVDHTPDAVERATRYLRF